MNIRHSWPPRNKSQEKAAQAKPRFLLILHATWFANGALVSLMATSFRGSLWRSNEVSQTPLPVSIALNAFWHKCLPSLSVFRKTCKKCTDKINSTRQHNILSLKSRMARLYFVFNKLAEIIRLHDTVFSNHLGNGPIRAPAVNVKLAKRAGKKQPSQMTVAFTLARDCTNSVFALLVTPWCRGYCHVLQT